ncbi:hypothetical protein GJ496_008740 [Pomphorhynchus laevis]|nr:hypothetical protein GJ496_008740 [Pomphorhynchus laevis]
MKYDTTKLHCKYYNNKTVDVSVFKKRILSEKHKCNFDFQPLCPCLNKRGSYTIYHDNQQHEQYIKTRKDRLVGSPEIDHSDAATAMTDIINGGIQQASSSPYSTSKGNLGRGSNEVVSTDFKHAPFVNELPVEEQQQYEEDPINDIY